MFGGKEMMVSSLSLQPHYLDANIIICINIECNLTVHV